MEGGKGGGRRKSRGREGRGKGVEGREGGGREGGGRSGGRERGRRRSGGGVGEGRSGGGVGGGKGRVEEEWGKEGGRVVIWLVGFASLNHGQFLKFYLNEVVYDSVVYTVAKI